METTLDFTRWTEKPRGLAYRRWVIASTGLRQLLRLKFFRLLLILAWTAGLLMAVAGFLFSQTIASGGWLEDFAANFGPRGEAVASAFTAVVLLYPDVVVHGAYTMVFWAHSGVGLLLCLVALTAIIPRLIARDRSGNALTIYLSRPLTSIDYLLGKFGIIVGVLLMFWTGPLLLGWLLSVLFAPDRVFVVYSLVPVGRALTFNLVALVALATISFGVSAIAKSTAHTILLWIGLWIVAGSIANLPMTPDWLRLASFTHDLEQIRRVIFQPSEALLRAAEALPLMNLQAIENLSHAGDFLRPRFPVGAFTGLGVLVAVSTFALFRRMRPE